MLTRLFAGMLMLVTLVGVAVATTIQAFADQNGQSLAGQAARLAQIMNIAPADRTPDAETDLRAYLPPAREGWKRFEWNAFAEKHLTNTSLDETVMAQFPELEDYLKLDAAMGRTRAKRGTWVYAGEGALLSIRVVQSTGEGTKGGRHWQEWLNDPLAQQLPRYALIRGVRFFEVRYDDWPGKSPKFRRIKARLGAGVTITVRAIADDAAIKHYLRAIDFDGLMAAKPRVLPEPANSGWVVDLLAPFKAQEPKQDDKPKVKINRGLRTDCKSIGNPRHCRAMAVDLMK